MKKQTYELTNPQKSIWLTEQFYKGTSVNNICGTVNVTEKLNFDVLKDALNSVIKNNTNLLLNFEVKDGNLVQFVTDYKYFDIELIDVKTEADVEAIEKSMNDRVFEIENSYLFEFKMFRYPDSTGGFVFCCHHLIGDSWSLGLTGKACINTYLALCSKSDEVTSSNYIDFCESEKNYLSSSKFEKDKEYWNTVFTTVPEIASIPSKNKNINEKISCKANRNTYEFSQDLTSKINSFCKDNRISAFNFITAVYSLYISRVCNLKDFVVGTPILNRTNFVEKNTTGMFVSTVPLRINLEDKNSFLDLASNIAQNSMSMLRHQKYPYEYLLKDLRVKAPNLPNLYNFLISYQITKTTTEGLTYDTRWNFNGNSADELQLHILDINETGKLSLSYDYKTQKYTSHEIRDLHKRIEHIIDQILDNNEVLLNDIEIVTEEEKKELLHDFNNTAFDYDKTKTISQLFEEQVEKTPDNIALVFEDKQLTYKELNEKANQLANYLREKQIKNNDIVGIAANRSIEMIVAILAVLKSGGAYIPIDPDYPTDRIEYMLENSNASLILTTKETNKIFNTSTIYIDLDNKTIYSENTKNPKCISKPDDLSYLIYTSGSTGKPKGVMLTQSNFTNLYYGVCKNVKYLKDDKAHSIVSITTVAFDIFAFESIISLTKGLKLFLTNAVEQKVSSKLADLIERNKIEIIQTTPSTMSFHLNSIENTNKLKSLKYIVLAGEQLPKILVNKLKSINKNIKIYNGYGPSEATIFATITDVTDEENITIGSPIVNNRIYILDKTHNLLPKYSLGELYISGDNVGKGYLNNVEQTNKNFVPNIYENNSIMYKIGDLGYWNDEGKIECKGRIDYQVKLRGLRVELGEIEQCIESFSRTNSIECAVILKNIDARDKLIAFLCSKEEIDISKLKNHLIKKLPPYMIPNDFIVLASLPHTPNGKIDRKGLNKYDVIIKTSDYVEPTTDTEKELCDMLASICDIKKIGIEDDFYSLGLDSLDIIKLSSLVIDNFGVEIPISKLYTLLDIKHLAQFIDTASHQIHISILKSEKKEYYPLSSAQKRIYYASKISNNPLLYNICGGLLVDKVLDKDKVINIFNILAEKHSAFRTCFKIIDNEPKQIIKNDIKLNIETHKHKKVNIQQLANSFPKEFNFEKAPLLRIELHYIGKNKTLLLIDSHHIILDGTSLNLLISEFCKLYNNESIEEEKIEYKDYSIWENNFNNSEEIKEFEQKWLKEFEDVEIPVINLPYDFPISQNKSFNGNTISTNISKDVFDRVYSIAKQYKVSPYVVFLSAFYVLLYKYTGQDNIIIGSPISGRFDNSLQNTLGMFVNNIPLLTNINSDNTFSEFINYVKNKVAIALDNGYFPYDKLVKSLKINSSSSLFDVMFIYQNENESLPKIEGKQIDILYANTKTSKFNLSMEIIPNTGKINVEYNTDLFKEYTVQNILKHYLILLENISNNANETISTYEIMSKEEKSKILYDFNDTKLKYDKNITLATLFEKRVAKSPNQIALVFEDKKLTYKELNAKANELANYLRNSQIVQNDIIGIMTERSLELIVAILASFKCGCTYIPIDPNFPDERITYMLENSNSKILLTTKNTFSKTTYENKLVINFDNLNIYNGQCTNLKNINSPDDNSYIIYTSGSTGKPKGVVLKQKSLTNLAYHLNTHLDFFKKKQKITMCSVTTQSFDIFLFESILSLQAGIKVVIANEDEQRVPLKLNKLIAEKNITAIQMTPSRMQFFIENIEDIPNLKKINYVILAGEPLTEKLVSDLLKIGVKKVYNGYGPSETTVFSTFTDATKQHIITIGKPLSNTQTYILDKDNAPCPIGVPGELYIAGDGVGNGYLNNIELTEKSFIENPFVENSIMYRVGDICKYTENGEILCLGRVDNQIKIRGLRIELGEIENLILKFPFIKKCVVTKQTVNSREFISAYYIAEKRIKKSELRAYLAKELPYYMIPSYFTALKDFPYTPNGKIDKKSLPLPNINTKNNYVAPKTEMEIKISKIFEDILSVKPVGIYDNFFELGGDSILAMRLNVELLKISNKITYSDIYDNPTVSDLITIINETKESNTTNIEIDNSKYEKILDKNIVLPKKFTKKNIGNILLTGSTGFLGIHILSSYLEHSKNKLYCIIRNEPGIDAKTKLLDKLSYYHGEKYNNLIDDRIIIINGDITKDNLGLSDSDYYQLGNNIDEVINCAAKVDHFGKYEEFYNVNVKGVKNLIDFCTLYNKKLYQVSTLSVSGNSFVDDYATDQNFNEIVEYRENNFYIGQIIKNVYIETKFEAEKLILDSILEGLDGYILRVGNLMPRFKDGIFQENYDQNAYINRLSAFLKLKCIPNNIYDAYVEFTPIDYCADAIIALMQNSNKNNRIFHIFNHNHLYLKDLLEFLNSLNYKIEVIEESKFKNKINSILNDDKQKSILNNLINDFGKDLKLNYESNVHIKSDFTIQYLNKIGFNWPNIDLNYIEYILKLIESR